MDPKKKETKLPETNTAAPEAAPETKPVPAEEENTHSNYRFALKILLVLLGIILVIVVLQSSGVPVAIRDWLFCAASRFSILRLI